MPIGALVNSKFLIYLGHNVTLPYKDMEPVSAPSISGGEFRGLLYAKGVRETVDIS